MVPNYDKDFIHVQTFDKGKHKLRDSWRLSRSHRLRNVQWTTKAETLNPKPSKPPPMQGILVHNAEVLVTVYKERLKLGVSGSLGSIGVSIIRIGFWAALWYSYNKEP